MSEDKTMNINADQLVLATYLSIFTKVVDNLIEESGHDPVMEKIPTSQLMNVFALFGNTICVKEVFKGFKKLCPEAMPSANTIKLMYMRYPFVQGMKIARLYFGTTNQKLVSNLKGLKE